jgi:hypothetical protein
MQLDMFLKEILLRENLVTIAVDSGKVTSVNFNTEIYTEFIKHLYCPKMYDPHRINISGCYNADTGFMALEASTVFHEPVDL